MSLTQNSAPFSCTVERLAFGGQGVSHGSTGKVLFVPFTLPTEEVVVQITHEHKNYDDATLLSITTSSPDRIAPPCPHYTRCGGCQLQHVSYSKQMDFKIASVQDSLVRIGHLKDLPEITSYPSDSQYSYRRKIRLRWIPESGAFGYCQEASTLLLPIETCLLFNPVEGWLELLKAISTILSQSEEKEPLPELQELSLTLIHLTPTTGMFVIETPVPLPTPLRLAISSVVPEKIWIGRFFLAGHKIYSAQGIRHASWKLFGKEFSFSPTAFTQTHPEQAEKLYGVILNDLRDQLETNKSPSHLLDLYCGVGILTCLASTYTTVTTGIEISFEAIATAKKNAQAHPSPKGRINFFAAPSAQLNSLLTSPPTHLIINPPRTGVDPSTHRQLAKLTHVQRIYYVSCMPSTLARDLKIILPLGYRLVALHSFDFFPQTGHIETLAILEKI